MMSYEMAFFMPSSRPRPAHADLPPCLTAAACGLGDTSPFVAPPHQRRRHHRGCRSRITTACSPPADKIVTLVPGGHFLRGAPWYQVWIPALSCAYWLPLAFDAAQPGARSRPRAETA